MVVSYLTSVKASVCDILQQHTHTHTNLDNTPVYVVLNERDSVKRLNACSDFISWNTNAKSVFNINGCRPHPDLTWPGLVWPGPYLL